MRTLHELRLVQSEGWVLQHRDGESDKQHETERHPTSVGVHRRCRAWDRRHLHGGVRGRIILREWGRGR